MMNTEETFHLGIKGLVRDTSGKILLLQVNPAHLKKYGHTVNPGTAYWDLPGGRVEKGATVLDTLKREIAEELGVTNIANVHPLHMTLSNIRIPVKDTTVGLILGVYTCDLPTDTLIVLSHEHIAFEWVLPAEAAQRLAVKYPPEFCSLIADMQVYLRL